MRFRDGGGEAGGVIADPRGSDRRRDLGGGGIATELSDQLRHGEADSRVDRQGPGNQGPVPIWDLVEPWLKSKGTISPRKLNMPALTGVKGNPGAA